MAKISELNYWQEYLLILDIKCQEWPEILSMLDCDNYCKVDRESLLVGIGDNKEFLNIIYGATNLTKREIKNKIEEVCEKCQKIHNVYIYILRCKEKRIIFESGHSENYYIRKIKNEIRERGRASWVHSTDTEGETHELLMKLEAYGNRK